MTALRGRVLDDEEAAKYWDERGAEPGGQGVRDGMFRDDPASRSTLRRGAPGRKAWVKPPPKPVVVDRTKELDAKRNFLALKVGGGWGWAGHLVFAFWRVQGVDRRGNVCIWCLLPRAEGRTAKNSSPRSCRLSLDREALRFLLTGCAASETRMKSSGPNYD